MDLIAVPARSRNFTLAPFPDASDPMAYLLTKSAHLVFVIAWMATVFYLPRILVNIAEAGDEPAVRARLVLMGRRLYRFGHTMFGIAVALGFVLWLHFGIGGGWLHAKLALVTLLLAYFIVAGRWLKGVDAGRRLPSAKALRWFNEVPVLVLFAIVYLVLAKPF
jgi:putative membrane protein